MPRIPKWVKRLSLELANNAFLVAVTALVFIGAASSVDITASEFIGDFIPLLLGLFGIGMTVTTLRISLKEGEERGIRERNEGVRPILITERDPNYTYQNPVGRECLVDDPFDFVVLYFSIENAGLGVALEVETFIENWDGKFYRITKDIPKLLPTEKSYTKLHISIPDGLDKVLHRYRDIYGNVHFCRAVIMPLDSDGKRVDMISNEYMELSDEEKAELNSKLKRTVYTQKDAIDRKPITDF